MPINEQIFAAARLRQEHRSLAVARTLVQVQWTEDAERFDVRSSAVVATIVADVDVPANACPISVGQVWDLEAQGDAGPSRFHVLSTRLAGIRPGESSFRRWYTWQFLVVKKPSRDPYGLFPRLARPSSLDEIPEEGADILGDLKALLASEIVDSAVARFNSEGGFRLQEAYK